MSRKLHAMRGTRSVTITNQPQGGGMKKSGLANSNLGSSGIGLMHGRTYLGGPRGVQANYKNKDLVFCINQIGGIGHSVGGRSLHNMMDGLSCQEEAKESFMYVEMERSKYGGHRGGGGGKKGDNNDGLGDTPGYLATTERCVEGLQKYIDSAKVVIQELNLCDKLVGFDPDAQWTGNVYGGAEGGTPGLGYPDTPDANYNYQPVPYNDNIINPATGEPFEADEDPYRCFIRGNRPGSPAPVPCHVEYTPPSGAIELQCYCRSNMGKDGCVCNNSEVGVMD